MTEVQKASTPSRLPLVIVGAVVAMAVVVTVILVAVRGPVTYDAGTPEAALQTFVTAVIDNDRDEAFALMTLSASDACQRLLDESRYGATWRVDDVRAELDEIEVIDDRATARVTVRTSSDTPFDSSSWSSAETFTLVLERGSWLVDRASWPYMFQSCTREAR